MGFDTLLLVLGGRCFDDFPFVDERWLLILFFVANKSLLLARGDDALSFAIDELFSSLSPGAYCEAKLLNTEV